MAKKKVNKAQVALERYQAMRAKGLGHNSGFTNPDAQDIFEDILTQKVEIMDRQHAVKELVRDLKELDCPIHAIQDSMRDLMRDTTHAINARQEKSDTRRMLGIDLAQYELDFFEKKERERAKEREAGNPVAAAAKESKGTKVKGATKPKAVKAEGIISEVVPETPKDEDADLPGTNGTESIEEAVPATATAH